MHDFFGTGRIIISNDMIHFLLIQVKSMMYKTNKFLFTCDFWVIILEELELTTNYKRITFVYYRLNHLIHKHEYKFSYGMLEFKTIVWVNMHIIHLSNHLVSTFLIVSNKNFDIKWNPIKCNHLSY